MTTMIASILAVAALIFVLAIIQARKKSKQNRTPELDRVIFKRRRK